MSSAMDDSQVHIVTLAVGMMIMNPNRKDKALKLNLFAAVTLGSPHFGGNSYLVVEKAARVTRHGERRSQGTVDISFLYLNFSTAELDGMILWSAKVSC
jgi:hypothetical protein